jgi:hypothetical protein
MENISYHHFSFPFQWSINGSVERTFSEKTDLSQIQLKDNPGWKRVAIAENENDHNVLYDEKNYFYKFIHNALYDNGTSSSLLLHFERTEPQLSDTGKRKKVVFRIETRDRTYELTTDAVNLNLYSTGVGVLSFYLYNNQYTDPLDILRINQLGRRIFPPYIESVNDRKLIAKSIEIKGLDGNGDHYREDFSGYSNKSGCNQPARFVESLISDIAQNIHIEPVLDDRMFVECWYKNDQWTEAFKNEGLNSFLHSDGWHDFVFVDEPDMRGCHNEEMQRLLAEEATYRRWQQDGTLYGVSRNSMVCTTYRHCPGHFLKTFETIYARMVELILVQKASVLRFSAEITNISKDSGKDAYKKVSSLHSGYIRFVNQMHFTEVSAQTPGIELYQMLYSRMNIGRQVDKLNDEIQELYNYTTLQEENKTNKTMSILTWVTTIALPITVIAGIFGMNNLAFTGEGEGSPNAWYNHFSCQFAIIIIITALVFLAVSCILRRKKK